MAYNVKFKRLSLENYNALPSKDIYTFYYVGNDLYLGEIKLSNASDLTAALISLSEVEIDVTNLESFVGNLSSLNTSSKTNLVSAINEVLLKENTSISQLEINNICI